jgi:hypothetical protein
MPIPDTAHFKPNRPAASVDKALAALIFDIPCHANALPKD